MAQFDFHTDEKKTIWYRKYFTIEAETIEEAKAKAIEKHRKGDWIEGEEYEQLTDTCEQLSVADNDGWPTEELYLDDDILWDNSDRDNEK